MTARATINVGRCRGTIHDSPTQTPPTRDRRRRRRVQLIGIVTAALLLAGSIGPFASSAKASTGALIGQITFSQACSSGLGVGITYDGTNLWYSCDSQSPDLFRANPTTGAVTGSWTIAGGLGSLAYDASRNAIWAAWSGPGEGNIWLINLDSTHSVTTSSVAFSTCPQLCFASIDDGLAYDASDDTLYISPDTSTTVYHYSTSGSALGSFPWAGSGCYNSGLGLGGNNLYQGSDGCNEIWVVSKSSPATVLTSFATGGVRDESLTCDPNTFATQGATVMWSKEAYSPIAYAFQIPSGSCGAGGTSSGPPVGGPLTSTEQTSGNPAELTAQCQFGSHPINCATGDFWHAFTDLTVSGRGLPLSLTRTYNALLASTNGPFGYGWSSAYTMSLTTDPSGNVTVHQENGSTLVFNPAGAGVYTAAPRVLATLTKNQNASYTFTRRQRQTYSFSASGQLTSATDLNGYATTLSYNGAGQLTTVTDPAGRTITLAYANNGDVATATDSSGRKVTYTYDGNGNLSGAVDVGGGTWSFTYDSSHHLLTLTDPRGGVVTNTYDASARVIKQSDAMSRVTTFDYTSIPGSTKITDPDGNVTVEAYSFGELASETRGYGTAQAATTTYGYDANTLGLVTVTDPNGHTTIASYDANGNRTSLEDPLHRKSTWTFDSLDDMTSMTDPGNVTTTDTYDAHGNLQMTTRPLNGTGSARTTSLTYGDPNHPGDVTAVTDPDSKVSTFTYDGNGDLASSSDPLNDKTTFAYDGIGRRTSMVSPNGNAAGGNPMAFTSTYTYNAFGDRLSSTDPLGHITRATHDADRNVATTTDADGNVTTNIYDIDNELTKVSRADGTTLQTGFDADGNAISRTDGGGSITTYAYDALNRVIASIDPLSKKTSYGYDAAGNETTLTDAAGQVTTYANDAANELAGINYSDGKTPAVTLTYTADGQRRSMVDGTGTTTYSYDSLNRLTSMTNGAGQVVGYGYDLKGQLTSLAYPNGHTVARVYDAAGRLTSVSDWLTHTTTFAYDADGNLTSQAYPNTTTTAMGYNVADQLLSISDAPNATPATPFASFSYTRDPIGQLASTSSTGTSQGNETYGYTKLNQLGSVNSGTYSYSAADNLTKLTSGATLGYDAANETTSLSNSAATFSYDSRGNQLTGAAPAGPAAFTYDQANRLTSYASSTGGASLATGGFHTVAVKTDGTVWDWGDNQYGELGNNSTTNSLVPVQVSGLSGIASVAAGEYHSVALKSDGTVWTWGYNSKGQLGDHTTTNKLVPEQVFSGAVAIAAGADHTLAVKADGTVWAWGDNFYGELGNNSTTNSSVPVQVSNLINVTALAAQHGHSMALKSDGTVWGWGDNSYGELGNNSTTNSKVPVQASGLTSMTAIAAGSNHSLAVKSDGSVWTWGRNQDGQLGNNTTTNSSVPVQVSGLSGVVSVAGGEYHSLAGKSDGTVWAWGHNGLGQLGNGTQGGNALVPAQVPGIGSVSEVAAAGSYSLALKSDGTAWGWGDNGFGQLGTNSTTGSLSPVQSRMTSVAPPASTAKATYSYNADGLRTAKAVGGGTAQFAWDVFGSNPLLLTDGTSNFIYGPNDIPVEQVNPDGSVSYLYADQLGSTRVLANASGTVTATYTFDAYGNTSTHTGTATTPLLFAAQFQDSESGLYYLRARYYDPATAQFLSRDPLGQVSPSALSPTAGAGMLGSSRLILQQPYGYANNNPFNATDPSGWGCFHYDEQGNLVFDSDNGTSTPVLSMLVGAPIPADMPPYDPHSNSWVLIGVTMTARYGRVWGAVITAILAAIVIAHSFFDDIQQILSDLRSLQNCKPSFSAPHST